MSQTTSPNNSCHDQHRATPRLTGRCVARVAATLGEADRDRIAARLDRMRSAARPGDELLAGLLRRKVADAQTIAGPLPGDVAAPGRWLSYMVSGGGAQIGFLDDCPAPDGIGPVVPVMSLLGATLIGMRVLQRAPLLREDGRVLTLVLLRVAQDQDALIFGP